MKTTTTKIKSPSAKNWIYFRNELHKNRKSNWLPSRIDVANYADAKWIMYTRNKIKETAEILGHEIKHRADLTDWQNRKWPKIRIGKYSYRLLPKHKKL